MSRLRVFVLAGATGLVSACAVGPNYQAPQLPVHAAGPYTATAQGVDPAAPLPDDWWRLYQDPVLDDLVARAFAANTDLRIASANLARAQAIVSEARAGRLPSTDLSGGVEYGDAGQSGQGSGGAQWTRSGSFGLAWEADLFGQIGRAIEASRADAEAVAAARDAVAVTVAAEVTRAYLDACSYAYSLDVARQSAAIADDSLRLVSLRERAGAAGRFDVERAGTVAANARAAIPAFEGARQVALFELAALLGLTPGEIPAAAQTCTRPPEPVAEIPVGDGSALLRRRPDLREAERRLAADTARIGVATADLYPSISIGGSGNFLRNDAVRGSDSLSFSLGPLISWRFPNVSVARARIRQAEAQGDASLAAFDGAVLRALKEVEQALARVTTEQQRRDALNQAAMRSERAWQLADQQYRAGSISYLDAMVAQTDMLNARANLAASLQVLSSRRADLFKALGGGWQAAQAPVGGQ